jgi:hypothetical protein
VPPVVSDIQDEEVPPVVSDAEIQDDEVPKTKTKPFIKPKTIAQEEAKYDIRPATRAQKTEKRREGFTQPRTSMRKITEKPNGGKSSRQTRRRSRKQSK